MAAIGLRDGRKPRYYYFITERRSFGTVKVRIWFKQAHSRVNSKLLNKHCGTNCVCCDNEAVN
jgi:hypothetical protein